MYTITRNPRPVVYLISEKSTIRQANISGKRGNVREGEVFGCTSKGTQSPRGSLTRAPNVWFRALSPAQNIGDLSQRCPPSHTPLPLVPSVNTRSLDKHQNSQESRPLKICSLVQTNLSVVALRVQITQQASEQPDLHEDRAISGESVGLAGAVPR
ncbi:hypothetical protein E2C01_002960 [Portunus trituberculatus]|uniref:Uncharacterized protein n=1 Tax=Portunus trituberculatus TaxID=210409 RepID=A0A5B7CPK3_PORTR|nr:hypothetical protein [Portunus trituberculatus]